MKSVSSSIELSSVKVVGSLSVPSQDRSSVLTSGHSAALLANLLWGTSFLASKYMLAAWGPFTAAALRFGLATLLMLAGLMIFGRRIAVPSSPKQWLQVILVSLTGFGALYPLQLGGLKLISSGLSAAIMLTSPLFVVLAGRVFLGETFTHRKLLGIGFGILGGVILLSCSSGALFDNSPEFILGMALTLGASMSLALSVIATRKLAGSLDSGSLTLWSMGIGFLMFVLSAQLFEHNGLSSCLQTGSFASWTALIFLAFVCSAICFFIWNYALAKATPKEIASTMHIKTPTAVLLGVIVAGESLTASMIVGTAVVMLGVWISQKATARRTG